MGSAGISISISFVVGRDRGGVGEGRVRFLGVVELYSSGDDPLGLEAVRGSCR